jgi:hypothetical protein
MPLFRSGETGKTLRKHSRTRAFSRDDAVETDSILHDPIKGWNATSGRVLEFLASKARPEVALHLTDGDFDHVRSSTVGTR